MQITIKYTKQTWKSPDGQRTIWEVGTVEGKVFKTFSNAIGTAASGTSWDVEEYQRTNKQTGASEAFIKQVKKEEGGSGKKSYASYTRLEHEALFEHAYEYVKNLLGPDHPAEVFSSMFGTYFIGAQRCGIKIRSEQPDPQAQPTDDMVTIENILRNHNAVELVQKNYAGRELLLKWWHEAGENDEMFIARVHKECDDNVPF